MQTHLEIKEYRLDDYDLDETKLYSLPIERHNKVKSTAYAHISTETLSALLQRHDFLDKFILVDCRYPYEFNGGHIEGAVNLFDAADLTEVFFSNVSSEKKIPIFYCEYSQCRGPNMAIELRSRDRITNVKNYPQLRYNEIYVLFSGYRNFFNQGVYLNHCTPQSYVQMDDINFKSDLKTRNWHKKSRRQRSVTGKVSRFYQEKVESTFIACKLNFSNDNSFLDENMSTPSPRSPGIPKSRRSV